jgi:non-canonical purine NTP pyrophosphatase (RdgB/HAM1 family)
MGFRLECVRLELSEPQALDPADVVESKARAAYEKLSRPVVVEDSGLEIHAWGRFPGALVKWLERTAGVEAIVRMLDAFSERGATATCALAYFDGFQLTTARGESPGSIALAPRGQGGFGWDPIFIPAGGAVTFAEMTEQEKDRVSHRRKAWEALSRRLPRLLGQQGIP